MVYTLRLIYEEERENLHLSKEVIIRIGELIHKMITLGFLQRKPANADLHLSLRSLAGFHIIDKLDGTWEEADARILILPSILFIVSNEQISLMTQTIEQTKQEKQERLERQENVPKQGIDEEETKETAMILEIDSAEADEPAEEDAPDELAMQDIIGDDSAL